MAKLLHECWGCHKVGLKPGILATKHGDYGMRRVLADYQELSLDSRGLCRICGEHPPANIVSEVRDA